MPDADARSDQDFADRTAVVAHLQRRSGAGDVEGVVDGPGEPQRLAKPAGAGGKLARQRAGGRPGRKTVYAQAPVRGPEVDSGNRFQGAEQHATGLPLSFATDVHAEITPIDRIDVGMAGRAEEDPV